MMQKVRVLIVDDAALVRRMLTDMLHTDPMIEVVGTASDPYIAREKIKRLHPDVLTLDVEMPRMDGLTFLRNLMRLHPLPVVMISSLTEQGADVTLQAMELGAVDFVSKPKIDVAHSLHDYTAEIIAKVKAASTARVLPLQRATATAAAVEPTHTADAIVRQHQGTAHFKTTERIVAVGASTGGTEALKEVLMHLPPGAPGMVITQHIPEAFSGPFARRMDSVSPMTVCEAQDGQQILPGHAYIAPGHRHLLVARDGARYMCRLHDGPPVNRHRPSVDVLFRSVAQHAGHNAIGVLLTGMGSDGAHGLKEMHDTGAITVVQDEKTSVVWGMPGQAVKLGGADAVLPLGDIAPTILKLIERSNGRVAC
jgi:two-component system chemotaxis response regulator CheB